ncbi:MAG: PKD domain-containing protein [Bacillota bacterium]
MSDRIQLIDDRYIITDVIIGEDMHMIYQVKGILCGNDYIINAYSDGEIIHQMTEILSYESMAPWESFIEFFINNDILYIVMKHIQQDFLNDFLSYTSAKLPDKIQLLESLLLKLREVETLPPLLQYTLSDVRNIAVTNKGNIHFHYHLYINKKDLVVDNRDVMERIADLISRLFTYSDQQENWKASFEEVPPAISSIIEEAANHHFTTPSQLYDYLRSNLIYETFTGTNPIVVPLTRVKIKRKNTRKPAVIILSLIVLLGTIWFVKSFFFSENPSTASIESGNIDTQQNALLASFQISNSTIRAGEEVFFINMSAPEDSTAEIVASEWIITKDDLEIHKDQSHNLTYRFDVSGNYTVSLQVKDSRGNLSESFSMDITVLEADGSANQSSGIGK